MNGVVLIATLLGRCFCQTMIPYRRGAKTSLYGKPETNTISNYIIDRLFTKSGHQNIDHHIYLSQTRR